MSAIRQQSGRSFKDLLEKMWQITDVACNTNKLRAKQMQVGLTACRSEPGLGCSVMQDTWEGISSAAVCRSCQHMDARLRFAVTACPAAVGAAWPSSRPTLRTTSACK